MAKEINIPRLGWSMDHGTFSRWVKHDGDFVNEGDVLFEVEGDKAIQPVESLDSGFLRILPDGPKPGDDVQVGQRLGYLCEQGELVPVAALPVGSIPGASMPVVPPQRTGALPTGTQPNPEAMEGASAIPGPAAPTPRPAQLANEAVVQTEQVAPALDMPHTVDTWADVKAGISTVGGRSVRVSPRAARTAAKFAVNLSDVTSTGSTGRIRERDVLAVVAQRSAPADRPTTTKTVEE